jgi:hypothetical protein
MVEAGSGADRITVVPTIIKPTSTALTICAAKLTSSPI